MAIKKAKILTGRRKESVARVRLKPGTGKITVNGRDFNEYFMRKPLAAMIVKPLIAVNRLGKVDIDAVINGGGLAGQAGALRYAISRALDFYTPEFRKPLKDQGFLTRDSRSVQRKMYGHKKARKSFQFSKR